MGRFELLAKLGEGGMSGVFHARDHLLGREVALKILLPRYLGRPEREQRLVDEAKYLGRVQGHPNIIELCDSGRLRDHDWPWLSTELLRGEVLDWLLVRSKLEADRVIDIARQVAAALAACHAHGIAHRDATPGNLFILEDGTVKLFDFSHAGDLRGPRLVAGAPGRLTGAHDTPGTIGYMSPEQAAKAPADPSMDVFAFGALLFELITRRNPFRQFGARDEFIRAQREGAIEVPKLHAWAYEVPEALAVIVHECTDRAVGGRPTMAEVVDRLGGIGPERGALCVAINAPEEEPGAAVASRTSDARRGRSVALLLVMLLLAAGAGAFLLARSSGSASADARAPAPIGDAPPRATRQSEPAPPPELALTPEPEPMIEAEVEPESPRSMVKAPATPGPKPEVGDSSCDGVEARGRAAFEQRRWREVVEHTARKACWSKKDARVLLRTTALFNLGRWKECAQTGRKSTDPKVRSKAEVCSARLDAPESAK
nr:protein kinase [Pseudenhygromyxa sp. WMMC2535]